MAQAQQKSMTLDEFLAWDDQQEGRYEYADGVVTLMAGSTDAHDDVRGAIFANLRSKLAGKPCRARLDLKLVCPNGRSRYPDVAVICGPRDPRATRLVNPVVLVEVTSPSTIAIDYSVKTIDYASVPSVQVYLLASQSEPRVDVMRRVEGRFEPVALAEGLDAVIDLPEIGVELLLADVYAGLTG